MKRKEALIEQCEDAALALLMDRAAQAEGNWAVRENARLKEDPSAAVPEALQRRCQELIRKTLGASVEDGPDAAEHLS